MMTANLRRTAYTGMQKDDFIGKIEDDQTTSGISDRSLEKKKPPRTDPLTYTASGSRSPPHSRTQRNHRQGGQRIPRKLLVEKRSEQNPGGGLFVVREYWRARGFER